MTHLELERDEIKQHCLKLCVNGMGFSAIERVTGVNHTTVIYWVKQVGEQLEDAPVAAETPQVGELDELEIFVGLKKTIVAKLAGKACKLERRKY